MQSKGVETVYLTKTCLFIGIWSTCDFYELHYELLGKEKAILILSFLFSRMFYKELFIVTFINVR